MPITSFAAFDRHPAGEYHYLAIVGRMNAADAPNARCGSTGELLQKLILEMPESPMSEEFNRVTGLPPVLSAMQYKERWTD